MKPHDRLEDQDRERAVLYALESLPSLERSDFEAHLAACAACRDEVVTQRNVVASLAEAAPHVAPPPSLRTRLLDRITRPHVVEAPEETGQAWKSWPGDAALQGIVLLGAVEEGWEQTGFDGVEARRLFVDEVADRVTMLVRMRAGSAYPPHRHHGPEECFVLSGDLDVGEVRMTAGSYQRVAAGSRHPTQSTKDGCMLLIVSSLHDELLHEHV